MDAEWSNTIVPVAALAGSALTAWLSHRAIVKSKEIDSKEKGRDRNQELRKQYVTRKIDMAEVLVSRYTLLAHQLDMLLALFSVYSLENNNSIFGFESLTTSSNTISVFQDAVSSEKAHYHLFFDSNEFDERFGVIIAQHSAILKMLIKVIFAMRDNNGEASQQEARLNLIKEAMPQYKSLNRDMRAMLTKLVADIRDTMKVYDIKE